MFHYFSWLYYGYFSATHGRNSPFLCQLFKQLTKIRREKRTDKENKREKKNIYTTYPQNTNKKEKMSLKFVVKKLEGHSLHEEDTPTSNTQNQACMDYLYLCAH